MVALAIDVRRDVDVNGLRSFQGDVCSYVMWMLTVCDRFRDMCAHTSRLSTYWTRQGWSMIVWIIATPILVSCDVNVRVHTMPTRPYFVILLLLKKKYLSPT